MSETPRNIDQFIRQSMITLDSIEVLPQDLIDKAILESELKQVPTIHRSTDKLLDYYHEVKRIRDEFIQTNNTEKNRKEINACFIREVIAVRHYLTLLSDVRATTNNTSL